ncbi:hypothetical protein AB6A23_11190 [Paenibacillus tarimensis]
MNVGEIITRIRLEIDNDLTDAQIIGRMNELQKRLFRKLKFPEKIYKFTTTEISYYALPADCPEDRIRCVVIDDIEYTKVSPEVQNPPPYFCTAFLGSLYINTNPLKTETTIPAGKDAYLYYRNRPVALGLSDLNAVPTLPEDYHELFVYDAAAWIAGGIQRDIDMKNNFQAEYDAIFKDAYVDLKKMGLKRAKETMIW